MAKIAEIFKIDLHWLITGKPSRAVEQLRSYTSGYIANFYEKIAILNKQRADLEIRGVFDESCKDEKIKVEKEIEELYKAGSHLLNHLNEVLDPMDIGFH